MRIKKYKSNLFTQTLIPVVLITMLISYFAITGINTMLLERFETQTKQELAQGELRINEMFKSHYTLLFYLYGADAKDFAKQNEAAKYEMLEKLSNLKLQNRDVLYIEDENGTPIFTPIWFNEAQKISTNTKTFTTNNTEYALQSFYFQPWGWHITYMLDVNKLRELVKSNYSTLFILIFGILFAYLFILAVIFFLAIKKPLRSIATQLNSIILGNYTTLTHSSFLSKEFFELITHINQVTAVIQRREKEAKEMLALSQQNESYVKDVLDSQRNIIVVNDTQKIVDVNESFFHFFEEFQTLQEFQEQHSCICDFFVKEEGFIYSFEDKNWVEYVLENPDKNNRVKIYKDTVSYIFLIQISKSKSQKRVIVSLTDITELETSKLKLIEAKELAEAATQAKSEFLANMSHEIRTPLNGILGFLEIMLRKEIEYDKQKYYFEIMQQNGKNLLNIINDILDLSKIESGEMQIVSRPCEIAKFVKSSTAHFYDIAKERGIDYSIEIDKNTPECVNLDETRLNQILYNLLSNALKFTHEGGYVRLLVSYNDNKDSIYFGVKDSGIGIAKENLENIFMAFRQADSSTTKEYGGTGLGLSISSTLVKMMGGEQLEVESKVAHGSHFFFELPYKPCN